MMPSGKTHFEQIPLKNVKIIIEAEKAMTSRQQWELLADELRRTSDIQRVKELVMALEETIFNRQQELTLHADKIDKRQIEGEKRALRKVLDLLLETKVKKLCFPDPI
jgi:hypothetical protein